MSDPYIGEIRYFAFSFAPVGWLACDGSLQQIAQNTALFSLLGTTYGGDGQATFGLPDLRGRIAIGTGQGPGSGPNRVPGEMLGQETVTLTSTQIPAHSHAAFATNTPGTSTSPGGTMFAAGPAGSRFYYAPQTPTLIPMSASAITPTGESRAHENCAPTLTIQACIASDGIYPSQS